MAIKIDIKKMILSKMLIEIIKIIILIANKV